MEFFTSHFPDAREKAQSRPRAGKGESLFDCLRFWAHTHFILFSPSLSLLVDKSISISSIVFLIYINYFAHFFNAF